MVFVAGCEFGFGSVMFDASVWRIRSIRESVRLEIHDEPNPAVLNRFTHLDPDTPHLEVEIINNKDITDLLHTPTLKQQTVLLLD